MSPERKVPKSFDPDKADNSVLLELLGSQQTVNEFRTFQNKEKQRQIRIDLEHKTSDVLEGELREDNEKAIEILNKVYRKAWTLACKKLGHPEEDYPSKY